MYLGTVGLYHNDDQCVVYTIIFERYWILLHVNNKKIST